MSKAITQEYLHKELNESLSTMLKEIRKDMNFKFRDMQKDMDYRFREVREEMHQGFEEAKQDRNYLKNILDGFLKKHVDFDIEFTIVKAEVNNMKRAFKNKLGIDVSIQGENEK